MEIDWLIDLIVRLVFIKLTGKLSRGIKQCHLCPFPKRQKHFPRLFAVAHLQVSRSRWVNLHHPLLFILGCLSACCLTSSDGSRWSDCGGSPAKPCLVCTEATQNQGMIPMLCKWPFLLWHWHEAAQHQAISGSGSQGQHCNPSGASIPFPHESLGPIFYQPSKETGLQSQGTVPWSLVLGKYLICFSILYFPVCWPSEIVMTSNVTTSWNGALVLCCSWSYLLIVRS